MRDAYSSLSNAINNRLIANSKPDFDRLTLCVVKLKLARNHEASNSSQVNQLKQRIVSGEKILINEMNKIIDMTLEEARKQLGDLYTHS